METGREQRQYWLQTMKKIADPVLQALSERRLHALMPVEEQSGAGRAPFAHLEALGRTLTGMAPWLESGGDEGEEGTERKRYAELAREAIDAGTDPASPDYMNFSQGHQPIVDAAFLAHALLRAPTQLIDRLEPRVKRNLAAALKATRTRKPGFNNWLLFSAMIETALFRLGEDWDPMRIDYAIKQHDQWYVGDGTYGDGPEYHADYYNSFVIQPMLLDIVEAMGEHYADWNMRAEPVLNRAKRYAAILERMISPEGTFPPLGRSLAYRFGVFQLLSQMALREQLPDGVEPAQVRCALTAVIRRMIEMPGTFDERGWLRIGFCGHQPFIGESYISTGSLYLCMAVFLPLGLKSEASFWKDPPQPWTSQKLWSGAEAPIDQALKDTM